MSPRTTDEELAKRMIDQDKTSSQKNSELNIVPDNALVNGVILEIRNLGKIYRNAGHELTVLHSVNMDVHAGESCAIIGPSGSGKTTLLGLCAGLDQPSQGHVKLAGEELGLLSEDQRAALRNRLVGFVFQNFQLIPTLTALENVLVPLELRGQNGEEEKAEALLAQVGLKDRLDHYPTQLSGGEQQRVALARAFIHRPALLFADEPTGNLDNATSEPIVEMLFRLNKEAGTALVLVTHDPALAAKADRVISMRAGRIVSEENHARS
ncbi:MAG: ABC transporter ATP-binding protein [Blastochloris sp.]|jgi:putative ABC transport system ATP-binding protein|nr:ABC transporter ATP-binding protein [Blastochloris sp.]